MPLTAERRTNADRNTGSPRAQQSMSRIAPAALNRAAPSRNVGNPFNATPMK